MSDSFEKEKVLSFIGKGLHVMPKTHHVAYEKQ